MLWFRSRSNLIKIALIVSVMLMAIPLAINAFAQSQGVVSWSTEADFSQNASTTGEETMLSNVDVSNDGNVSLPSINNQSDGSDGELIIDGTDAQNCFYNGILLPGGPYNAGNPLVLDTNPVLNIGRIGIQSRIWNFTNVTLRNGAVLSHSEQAGAVTDVEGVEIRATGTVQIDSTSKIEVTGKGYNRQIDIPIPGTPSWTSGPGGSPYARGGGYGASGGKTGWGTYYSSISYGTASGVEFLGSAGGPDKPHNTWIQDKYKGAAGGRVKIVTSVLDIEGSIQANGKGGQKAINHSGGGSGGGILIYADSINFNGILSAAGGGGGTGQSTGSPRDGDDGKDGYGGNSSASGGAPGIGGKGGGGNAWTSGLTGGGPSAGGGAGGSNGGGGGAAGRIAVYYNTFNSSLVNGGNDGYAQSPVGIMGPYAYFVRSTSVGNSYIRKGDIGTWGERPFDRRGLIVDAGEGNSFKWKDFKINADGLSDINRVKWQIRTANDKDQLDYQGYVGPNNRTNDWYDGGELAVAGSSSSTSHNWINATRDDFDEGQKDNVESTTANEGSLVIEPSINESIVKSVDADTYLNAYRPDRNFGTQYNRVYDSYNDWCRTLLKFDLSSVVPESAIITSADLSIFVTYVYTQLGYGTPFLPYVDRNVWVYRMTQTNWTEMGATRRKYDGINFWAKDGGDYTTENGVLLQNPFSVGTVNVTVKDQVEYAINNVNREAHFLMKYQTERSYGGEHSNAGFNS